MIAIFYALAAVALSAYVVLDGDKRLCANLWHEFNAAFGECR